MWEKPAHRKIEGTARPLRVAYLIDLETCEDLLVDEIIAESYSRWSGRRTPIIPASRDGIDPNYRSWLYYFDADVIYSFADLKDEAIARIDEELAPGVLLHHKDMYRDPEGDDRYQIDLPFEGLSCLSVLPVFTSRRWGGGERPQNIRSFDAYWDGSDNSFLRENFGFLSTSFGNLQLADSAPELFTCLTLISKETLENRKYGKSEHAEYVCHSRAFLEALSKPGSILPPCQLSELFCHYLEPSNSLISGGVNVIVGDSVLDRLVYWNAHNRFPRSGLSAISSLRISVEQSNDNDFLESIGLVLDRRGVRNDQNSPVATIRSTSIDENQLHDIAERMKPKGKTWKRYDVEKLGGDVWAIPAFRDERPTFTTGPVAFSREPKGQKRSEILSGRAEFPLAAPWHLSEGYLPPSVRFGKWMVDLSIDRENDHCPASNVVHEWILPRRLRIDSFFSISRESSPSDMYSQHCQRPTKSGHLSASIDLSVHQGSIFVPKDEDALFGGMRDVYRDRFLRAAEDEIQHRCYTPNIKDAKYSDKGRYLLGTLQHFPSLPDALETLLHDFWRATLRSLGANPSHLDDRQEDEFQNILSKRLRANNGDWKVLDSRGRQTVVREALRIASQIRRPDRFMRYDIFESRYNDLVTKFLERNPHLKKRHTDGFFSSEELDASLKYLCERKILFQGHEWQCQNCFNRNWVSIDDLSSKLSCSVCQNEARPPVSGGWHFKASGFFVEAYSDHGIEPTLWALWRLAESAKTSFYFLPSTLIWFDKNREDGPNDCEVDLVAVVDGDLIAVEATTSKTLKANEIDKLVAFANRVRPNLLYIVCGESRASGRKRLSERVEKKIMDGIAVRVDEYRKCGDRINPHLPF